MMVASTTPTVLHQPDALLRRLQRVIEESAIHVGLTKTPAERHEPVSSGVALVSDSLTKRRNDSRSCEHSSSCGALNRTT